MYVDTLVDCTCGHREDHHFRTSNGNDESHLPCMQCTCPEYDPNGHNPEQYNFLCPKCEKVRMDKAEDRTYFCYSCTFILFEKQVEEMKRKGELKAC